jgi:signal transduction histidine kinase
VVEDQRSYLEEAGLSLSLVLPPEPILVKGDALRLSQVLVNLLNNAAKFTDAGGTVTVSLFAEAGRVAVTVRDTGVGIAAEMLPHVFKSFTQEERSLARSRGGLGLGLALVKGIVELHGGEVSGSSPGRGCGAEFTFRLPRAEPDPDGAPVPEVTHAAISGSALGSAASSLSIDEEGTADDEGGPGVRGLHFHRGG